MSSPPALTFAAAQGACLDVGLELLLASDVVYVAENVEFGPPFAKLGATLDSGGHWYFTERLGMHRTSDLIYTAELISESEAVAQGLFSGARCQLTTFFITAGGSWCRWPSRQPELSTQARNW